MQSARRQLCSVPLLCCPCRCCGGGRADTGEAQQWWRSRIVVVALHTCTAAQQSLFWQQLRQQTLARASTFRSCSAVSAVLVLPTCWNETQRAKSKALDTQQPHNTPTGNRRGQRPRDACSAQHARPMATHARQSPNACICAEHSPGRQECFCFGRHSRVRASSHTRTRRLCTAATGWTQQSNSHMPSNRSRATDGAQARRRLCAHACARRATRSRVPGATCGMKPMRTLNASGSSSARL